MRRYVLLLALGLITFRPATVLAQTGPGRISGVVKDASGAVVPGVTIEATHEETGIRQHTITTDAGLFVFPSLPVGPYRVQAELSGFRTVTREKNILSVGTDLSLSLRSRTREYRRGDRRHDRQSHRADVGVVAQHADRQGNDGYTAAQRS